MIIKHCVGKLSTMSSLMIQLMLTYKLSDLGSCFAS